MTGFLSSQRCFETYVGTSVEWRRTWRKATRGAGSCVGPRAARFGSAAPPLEGPGHRGHRVSTSRLLAFLSWGQNLRGPVGSRRGRFLTEETSGAFQRELGMFAAKQTTPSPRHASAGSFALSVDRAHNPWRAPCRTILDPADMWFYVPSGHPINGRDGCLSPSDTRTLQPGWLIDSRGACLTVLEAGSPRSRCPRIQCLARTHFLIQRSPSHGRRRQGSFPGCAEKGTNPTLEGYALRTQSLPTSTASGPRRARRWVSTGEW